MMKSIVSKVEQLLPNSKIDIFGKDQLLHSSFPYYLLLLLEVIVFIGKLQTAILVIFILYTFIPLLDQFLSFDIRNPTQAQRKQLEEKDFFFKLAIYVTVIVDWIFFFLSLKYFSELEINSSNISKLVAYVVIYSNLNAAHFGISHQLLHRQVLFDKYLGTIHMIKNLYVHFTYAHIFIHHRKVATPEDPATSTKGETVYQFLPKSFLGQYTAVYQMEQKQGKKFYTNYCVLSIIGQIVFTILIFKIYGFQTGIFFLIQAFGTILYAQIINYIEHYGLMRQKRLDGTYEKVSIRHSWNAPHRFTNYLTFKIQRHSDHHQNSQKPYQTLLLLQDSPHFPHGYTVCIIMALFPSLWFKIMNPLVDQYNKNKNGKITQQVKKKAVKQTRQFLLTISLFTSSLLFIYLALK